MSTPFYRSYLNSPAWRLRREPVLRRAAGRCERCRDFAPSLQVHHKHYRTLGQESPP